MLQIYSHVLIITNIKTSTMKRSFIISLLLLMFIFSSSYSQPINMGFEGTCSNPSNAFFTGCFPNWTSACGSPDVDSENPNITPFEGSKYAHLYGMYRGDCSSSTSSRTEGIILNHNFKQGYTYRISYAIQWDISATGNCHTHKVNWLLTNGLANQTGDWQSCANDGGVTPAIPAGSQSVENFSLPSGNSGGWQVRTVDFTPIADFTQLVILNPVTVKSNCSLSSERRGDIFLDAFSLEVICDPTDVPWFTMQTNCTNGVLTVTATATDLDPQNQWWGLYQTDTPVLDGGVLIAQISGSVTATFTIPDPNKFYYIKHGIWGTCYNWREKRELVALPQADYGIAFPSQYPLSFSNRFCYGFPISMTTFSGPPAAAFTINLLRRPINSLPNVPFVPYASTGNITGPIPSNLNLANLFAGLPTPVYFEPNFEYLVRVNFDPANACYPNAVAEGTVIVTCCEGYLDANFCLEPNIPGGPTYILRVKNYVTYNHIGALHEWVLLSSPAQGVGPYTVVTTVTTSLPAFNIYTQANYNVNYMVVHRLRTACGEICMQKEQLQTGGNAQASIIVPNPTACTAIPINCNWIDSILHPCAVPTGLFGSCSRRILVWNPVQGAAGYTVEISYNDPACCRSANAPVGMRYEVTGSSLPLWSIATPKYDCFRWRVMTRCANGATSAWSAWQCYYCPTGVEDGSTGGVLLRAVVKGNDVETKGLLSPIIFPNPNNGEMTLSLHAPGDLVLSVDVITAQGRRVTTIASNTYKGGVFNTKLSLGAMAKGVYTVVFNTNYGIFRKKVIVQ
jgi:hypothetical protein